MKRALVVLCLLALSLSAHAAFLNETRERVTTTANGDTIYSTYLYVPTWKRVLIHAACMAGQISDARSTTRAIDKFGLRELNPVMKPVVKHPTSFLVFKIGIGAYGIRESERAYRKGNPRWWVSSAGCAVIGGGAAASNEYQIYRREHAEP